MKNSQRRNYTIFTVILAVGFIIGAMIISDTWRKTASSNVTIAVTGSASKQIKPDLGTWESIFSNYSLSMTEAYSKLQANNDKGKSYLFSFEFPEDKLEGLLSRNIL